MGGVGVGGGLGGGVGGGGRGKGGGGVRGPETGLAGRRPRSRAIVLKKKEFR